MKTNGFLTVACVSLAISFMFSCSSGNDDVFQPPSSSSSPPSGTVLCLLGSSCVPLGISDCVPLGGTPVDFCPSDGVSSSSSVRSSSSMSVPGTSSSSSVTAGGGTSSSSSVTAGGNSSSSVAVGGVSSSSGGGSSSSSACTNPSSYGSFNTVTIGGKVWMSENLNYAACGSKCYDNDPANCVTYGRLYDWATAMALDANCNSSTCSHLIQTKHKGVCPSGWHIPSSAEWDALSRFADGTSGTENPYNSPTAGRYLKATNGWSSNGNGEDTYGFAALPGGGGNSDGNFGSVGTYGRWWSASENNSDYAYLRSMGYSLESAIWYSISKDGLFSVRCLQD